MLAILVAIAACGRVGFDERTDAGRPTFGAPTLVMIDEGVSDPAATSDLRTLYVQLNVDIAVATRPDSTAAWSPVTLIPKLADQAKIENVPALSDDGMTMWLGCSTAPMPTDICVSTQSGGEWQAPLGVQELSTADTDSPGSVFDGDRQMAFTSDRGGFPALYLARRTSVQDPWQMPIMIAELNNGSAQAAPHVIPSGLRLYFAADRGQGQLDLYVASRTDVTSGFGPPELLSELASPGSDDDPWVSPDETTILFISDRDGTRRLYMATR